MIFISAVSDSNLNNAPIIGPPPPPLKTQFYYAIQKDIDGPLGSANVKSDFMKAQCGSYNLTTNPTGIINRIILWNNDRNHEALSSVRSHYAAYKFKFSDDANNIGVILDKLVALIDPSSESDITAFKGRAQTAATVARDLINSFYGMHEPTPPGTGTISPVLPYATIDYDDMGVFGGFFSYGPPYAACPPVP
jgi:hypothetical protein